MSYRSLKAFAGMTIVGSLVLHPPLSGQTADSSTWRIWPVPALAEGAEFYFSPDGASLIGNAKQPGDSVFHVYTIALDGSRLTRINDTGDDACSFFFPDGKQLIYTSTKDHLDFPRGNYSDPNNYPQGSELYITDLQGLHGRRLTNNTYYDAEVSVSPDGQWVLFTRQIEGQLDLWKVRPTGTEETRITNTWDLQEGGSFYIDDHTILYRAWEKKDQGRRGMPMTIYTIRDDGTGRRQVTHEPGTNWAPHPAPDGTHFVFVKVVPPGNFEIFLGNLNTGESQRLTFNDAFDGFPALSPDGKLLTFSSVRENKPGEHTIHQYLMDISSLNLGRKEKRSEGPDTVLR